MQYSYVISKFYSLSITFGTCVLFLVIGIYYTKNFRGINSYLVADRKIGFLSLTTSLIASALGAWVLFGPASAATWGGMGAVIGYALGTAFPFLFLTKLGKDFRKKYPKGRTLTEIIKLEFGKNIYKLILLLSIFYMTIFLIAEVTAISMLLNYISGADLWMTAIIVVSTSLVYTLYGGLRASIFTDNIQFFLLLVLLILCFCSLIYFNKSIISLNFIKENRPELLSFKNYTNYTAGLTFFIAVSATNLFHQGNWQRVYAAKNYTVLKNSLLISCLITIPLVFFMGYCGLIAISKSNGINPDLAFFSLFLKKNEYAFSLIIIFLGISLTVSSVDTLINAISSYIIVDGRKILRLKSNYLYISRIIITFLCVIAFAVASKGISILYLFLLADLFCCSAVASIFFTFNKKFYNRKNILTSILLGLVVGVLFFPSPDFTKSIIFGIVIPIEVVPTFLSSSLLFLSFIGATLVPILFWKIK